MSVHISNSLNIGSPLTTQTKALLRRTFTVSPLVKTWDKLSLVYSDTLCFFLQLISFSKEMRGTTSHILVKNYSDSVLTFRNGEETQDKLHTSDLVKSAIILYIYIYSFVICDSNDSYFDEKVEHNFIRIFCLLTGKDEMIAPL